MYTSIYSRSLNKEEDYWENNSYTPMESPNFHIKRIDKILDSPHNESSLLLKKRNNDVHKRVLRDISNRSPTLKGSRVGISFNKKKKDLAINKVKEPKNEKIEYEYTFIGEDDLNMPDFFGFFRDPLNLNRLYINYYNEQPENKSYWENWLSQVPFKKDLYDETFIDNLYEFGISHELRHVVWEVLLDIPKFQANKPSYYDLKDKGIHPVHGKQIRLDLNRTFSSHYLFISETSKGQLSLSNILNAYAFYNERVGYCQGMAFLAGMLVILTNEEQAFWMFTALLELCDIENYYEPSMSGFLKDTEIFVQMLKDQNIQLYEHFEKYNIEISFITSKWFLQLFVDLNDWRTVLRIWDIIMFEKKEGIFKCALGILNLLTDDLLTLHSSESLYSYLLNINAEKIHYSKLFPSISDVNITRTQHNIQKSNNQLVLPKKSVVKELWNKLKNTTQKPKLKPKQDTLSTPVTLHNMRKRLSPYAKKALCFTKCNNNETQWEGVDELLMDSTEKKAFKDSIFKLKHKNIDTQSLSPILIKLD